MKRYYVAAAILVVVALGAIGGSYFTGRGRVLDERRVSDLNELTSYVGEYADRNERLPMSLNDLQVGGELAQRLGDYEYRRLPDASGDYELCATFATDTQTTLGPYADRPGDYFDPSLHGKGRQCFRDTTYISSSDL